MPRPRKPTALHIIENTFRPKRHADRGGEFFADAPLGDAPMDWEAPAKLMWQHVANALPAGVLTRSDRLIVELTVRLALQMREADAPSPALASQLRACLGALGLTPADRTRVRSAVVSPKDDVDKYFTG
jgi:hypothetical protein